MNDELDYDVIAALLLFALGWVGVAATRKSDRRWATALFYVSWGAILLGSHVVVLTIAGTHDLSREEFFTDHSVLGICAKLDLSILAVCIAIKLKQRFAIRVPF